MQNKQNYSIIKFIVVLISIVFLLKLTGLIKAESFSLISYSFLLYGIVAVYLSIGTKQKGFLFFNAIIFMTGVIFFLTDNFTFNNTSLLLLPSMNFILSAGFLILYLDDYKEKLFLITAFSSFVIGLLFILLSANIPFRIILTRTSALIIRYYPVAIILLGILLLFATKNKRGSNIQ